MSLFPNNYLLNIEKYKIKNKNKQNKYIASKPSFLMTSNTYRNFKEKELENKKVNMTLTTNNINNLSNQRKNNIYNYNIKSPNNNNFLTNRNSKKIFHKYINDENKENLKNKCNINNALINNKIKKEKNSFMNNKYCNININKENISTNISNNNNLNNDNFKKISINPKKKGRTLSSNINKIIPENSENKKVINTYRNIPKKEKELMLNEYNDHITNHKKSNSIVLSENNLNILPSKSFCFNNLFKLKQSQKNKSIMRNNLINQESINNKSIFNNTTNQFYTRLKQIIPNNEANITNNKINDYTSKNNNSLLNKYKNMNKNFTSSNFATKFGINQYQFNNINSSINLNKKRKNYKTKSITNISNIDSILNRSKDSLPKKAQNNTNKIKKKILKIDSCTIPGYSMTGIKQKNLDSFFLQKNFLNKEEHFLIGICDGHGIYGDLISQYISQNLPSFLQNISEDNLIQAYIDINNSLINNKKIDCSLSGTTCTSLIISLEKIICANIGNTRAILARYENGYYNTINLNRDHKPTELDEIKRIISQGGIIRQNYDKIRKEYKGQERIFLKNSDIPGLNMSRSFGDNLAHSIGVINIPEVKSYEFTGNEKFIVIATDSIWQFIDSDECVEIIKDFYEKNLDAIGALNALVTEAIKRWKKQENKIEDITAVVIFFE